MTPGQITFAADLQGLSNSMKAGIARDARRALIALKAVEDKRSSDNQMFADTFGDGSDGTAAKQLDDDIVAINSVIDTMFATGMISTTRAQMEDSIKDVFGAEPS